MTPTHTIIGCQQHKNQKWLDWQPTDEAIAKMHDDASVWWAKHKEAVCAVIRDVMAA